MTIKTTCDSYWDSIFCNVMHNIIILRYDNIQLQLYTILFWSQNTKSRKIHCLHRYHTLDYTIIQIPKPHKTN